MTSIELKIKSKSLAEEASIIRKEEQRLKRRIEWHKNRQKDDSEFRDTWHSINNHRRWDVRNEARATYLARAFIEGRSYNTVETPSKSWDHKQSTLGVVQMTIIPKVYGMVNKYSGKKVELAEIKAWIEQPELTE